jgi:hypothetical protein
MSVAADPRAVRRARLKLFLLAVMFAAPVVIAYVLYFGGWRPQAPRLHGGELLDPARPVSDVKLRAPDGKPVAFSSLKGKWTLLYFGPAECLRACRDDLYKMQQVHAAQGREAGRVQRAFIVTEGQALDLLRYTALDYPGTLLLLPEPGALAALARDFTVTAGSPLAGLHRVYVVDPLGNLVLSYPADADPSGMLKDLARLLRASRVG